MLSREDPRQHLTEAALKLFASRGYYNTSIADILRESGCKRGSLYHYFSSKEELGYAAIDEMVRRAVEERGRRYLQTNEHPIDRLLTVVNAIPTISEPRAAASAPNLGARMASVHEGFRERLGKGLAPLAERVEETLRKGVADGQIADSVDPRQMAHVFITVGSGIQFACLMWEEEAIWEDARRWLKEYLNSLRR